MRAFHAKALPARLSIATPPWSDKIVTDLVSLLLETVR